jgi:hypothetical protein
MVFIQCGGPVLCHVKNNNPNFLVETVTGMVRNQSLGDEENVTVLIGLFRGDTVCRTTG